LNQNHSVTGSHNSTRLRDMSLSQTGSTRIARGVYLCTDMDHYEIRILKENGQQLVIEVRLMGDHAAIRRARTLATDTDRLEVWRGMTCVYSTLEALAIH
jgi:hypothetical protein